eukprot:5142593-Prymnesium_polylepis.1
MASMARERLAELEGVVELLGLAGAGEAEEEIQRRSRCHRRYGRCLHRRTRPVSGAPPKLSCCRPLLALEPGAPQAGWLQECSAQQSQQTAPRPAHCVFQLSVALAQRAQREYWGLIGRADNRNAAL